MWNKNCSRRHYLNKKGTKTNKNCPLETFMKKEIETVIKVVQEIPFLLKTPKDNYGHILKNIHTIIISNSI